MQLNRKTALLTALLPAVVLLGAGCNGINSSHSVSPATFLLPGFFGQSGPQAAPSAEPAWVPAANLAQAFPPAH